MDTCLLAHWHWNYSHTLTFVSAVQGRQECDAFVCDTNLCLDRKHAYGDVYSSPGLDLRQKQLLGSAFLVRFPVS